MTWEADKVGSCVAISSGEKKCTFSGDLGVSIDDLCPLFSGVWDDAENWNDDCDWRD